MANKTEKMTNKKALEAALSFVPAEMADVREKLAGMLEQLDKKNTAPKKMTDTQRENEGYKAQILELLADGVARTVTEVMASIPALAGLQNQRVSAIMRVMHDTDKTLTKFSEKRRSYFKLADAQ